MIIALISTNPSLLVLSPIDHFYIELFGTLFAGILAFYYLSRAYTFKDKFSLFIGIGFLVNALIDLLHVLVSFLNMDDTVFIKYFIPQTWFAGRLFLSAMLFTAIVKYNYLLSISSSNQEEIQKTTLNKNNNNRNKLSKLLLIYLIVSALFALFVAISSLFVVFPLSVIDNFPLHRPYELFPLSLFLLSIFYFYRNKLYKNKDIFYTSLVISIVFDTFGQIIMSYSAHHFDTAHIVAHLLKDAGYFINIIGLALSSIHYNIKLRETNELLGIQYKKVKESEKMKQEFVNMVAHEFRTPIQPIIGLTQVIYSKIKDKELHELLEIIMRNAERLGKLTNNVLDVTTIENKSFSLDKEKINLNDVILEVLQDYQKKKIKLLTPNIVYDYKLKDNIDSIFVEADRERLIQVLHNLLDNALKFTKSYQKIFVIVDLQKEKEGKEDLVIVSVKDTGKGISKDILPKLFSKFTTIGSNSGTGLGLYICKNIVEAHGGKIWAENNSDGSGATFSFTLPLSSKKIS